MIRFILLAFAVAQIIIACFIANQISLIEHTKLEIIPDKKIIEKMKYHGTLYTYNKEGRWYFKRNGKECLLW